MDRYCGRIDDHEPHEWSRPPTLGDRLWGQTERFEFWCPGPPITEGGWRS